MGNSYSLGGLSILVVEDEPLIALDMAALFQSAGAHVLTAQTLVQAATALEHHRISAAVLDYRIGAETTELLCRSLVGRGIPVMFYTGCGELQQSFSRTVVVEKPASGEALLRAMAGLAEPAHSEPIPVGSR